jgi:phosphoenolpyruvate carboxylase
MANQLSLRIPRSGSVQTSRNVRANVKLMDALLDEAIRYLDGEEAGDLVAAARRAASDGDAHPHLNFLFSAVKADEAMLLARAFTCHSMLANIGEDVAGRRRDAEADVRAGAAHTVAGALEALDLGPDALNNLDVVPVLTAHPTEVRRRALVDGPAARDEAHGKSSPSAEAWPALARPGKGRRKGAWVIARGGPAG